VDAVTATNPIPGPTMELPMMIKAFFLLLFIS